MKTIFVNPKIMALSGLLAMLPKSIMTGLIACFLGFLIKKGHFWTFFLVVYPIVALVVDIILYGFKDRIWKTLPKSDSIPEEWRILPEELLAFAKQLPKVRLMRLLGCLLLLPFMSFNKGSISWKIFSCLIIGYFICALFDWVWLKIFKLKKPEYIIKQASLSLSFREYLSKTMQDNNPAIMGTSAWIRNKFRKM